MVNETIDTVKLISVIYFIGLFFVALSSMAFNSFLLIFGIGFIIYAFIYGLCYALNSV